MAERCRNRSETSRFARLGVGLQGGVGVGVYSDSSAFFSSACVRRAAAQWSRQTQHLQERPYERGPAMKEQPAALRAASSDACCFFSTHAEESSLWDERAFVHSARRWKPRCSAFTQSAHLLGNEERRVREMLLFGGHRHGNG